MLCIRKKKLSLKILHWHFALANLLNNYKRVAFEIEKEQWYEPDMVQSSVSNPIFTVVLHYFLPPPILKLSSETIISENSILHLAILQ